MRCGRGWRTQRCSRPRSPCATSASRTLVKASRIGQVWPIFCVPRPQWAIMPSALTRGHDHAQHPDGTDRQHSAASRAAQRHSRKRWLRSCLGSAVRARHSRHHRAVRGDRVARHQRWRAAQVPQLLDVLRAAVAEHGPGRLQDSIRRWSRATDAAADRRARSGTTPTPTATWTSRSSTRIGLSSRP